MFGISFPELLLVFTIVLIVFGPNKLPEIAKTLGFLSGKLKNESDKLRRDFYNSVYKPAEDFKQTLRDEVRNLEDANLGSNSVESAKEIPLKTEQDQ